MTMRPGKPLSASAPSGTSFLTEVQNQAPCREQLILREQSSLREAAKACIKDAQAKSTKITKDFIEKHCRADVSEEWKKVDDKKIAKLRGVLAALQEENQSTQVLKKESENKAKKQELDATRSSVQLRLGVVQEKEELFKARERELQAHVRENEKSLHEQQTKIEKDTKKSKDELAECKRLDKDIEMLQAEYKEQEDIKEDELKKIAQLTRYKKFLETVVQECEADFEGDTEVLINRHNTLQQGNQELFQASAALSNQHDKVRDEGLRVQTKLQNEHLRISSQLHECQVNLDRQRAINQEREAQLNRALEDKELKESKVGVIQMAIEQLYSRTLASETLNQSKTGTVVESKFQPVLGDRNDVKLAEMLRKIVERMEDLKDILKEAEADKNIHDSREVPVLEEVEVKVQFLQQSQTGSNPHRTNEAGDSSDHLTATSSQQRRLQSDGSGTSGATSQDMRAHASRDLATKGDDGYNDE